ncbi:unnamed protein product [Caenorhabditis brenneri]
MSCSTPSSSECSIGSVESFEFKCEVCLGKGHGNHFGVNACRACAAFFRRMILGTGYRQKCRLRQDCTPKNGRWFCKKCRLEKCYDLGMTPDNIQHDRDAFLSSQLFLEKHRKRKLEEKTMPTSVEKFLGAPHTVIYFRKEKLPKQLWTFIDLSLLLDKAENILRTNPTFDPKTYGMTTIEKLAFGLKEMRRKQDNYPAVMKTIGKEETCNLWESQLISTANWIMYFDEFRELPFHQKFEMLKCMWHIWGRLERLSMTAQMRVNGQCGKRQFVVSYDSVLDYDNIACDTQWSTSYTQEELLCFLDPPTYYGEPLMESFINISPTDTELVFLLCNLCLRLTGKKLGGEIEEVTQKLQDILADSLHKYYKDMEVSRYAHRLTKILSISNEWLNLMYRRREKMHIAYILDAFHVEFSHPELFQYST